MDFYQEAYYYHKDPLTGFEYVSQYYVNRFRICATNNAAFQAFSDSRDEFLGVSLFIPFADSGIEIQASDFPLYVGLPYISSFFSKALESVKTVGAKCATLITLQNPRKGGYKNG